MLDPMHNTALLMYFVRAALKLGGPGLDARETLSPLQL